MVQNDFQSAVDLLMIKRDFNLVYGNDIDITESKAIVYGS